MVLNVVLNVVLNSVSSLEAGHKSNVQKTFTFWMAFLMYVQFTSSFQWVYSQIEFINEDPLTKSNLLSLTFSLILIQVRA